MTLDVLRAVEVGSDVDELRRVVVHRPGEELGRLTAANAARHLFDGPVDVAQAQREHDELTAALRGAGAEVVDLEGATVPNLLYTRDLFAVVGATVARARLRRGVRQAEEPLAEALLRAAVPGGTPSIAVPVEGGDVVVLGEGRVVLGISERTSASGAARLAAWLLARGAAREVVGAVLPPDGPFHLDLAMTLVDHGTVLADLGVLEATTGIRWHAGAPAERTARVLDLLPGLRVIATSPDDHGRSWDRGVNVVAVRPATVVAYADNVSANRRLERAGIEVVRVPGKALGIGRGGPRCMTAPLARAQLP